MRIWIAVVQLATELTAWMRKLALASVDARRWEPQTAMTAAVLSCRDHNDVNCSCLAFTSEQGVAGEPFERSA